LVRQTIECNKANIDEWRLVAESAAPCSSNSRPILCNVVRIGSPEMMEDTAGDNCSTTCRSRWIQFGGKVSVGAMAEYRREVSTSWQQVVEPLAPGVEAGSSCQPLMER